MTDSLRTGDAPRYADLRGKVVLVTGAASGIGLAAVREFARQGARIVAADVSARLSDAVAPVAAGAELLAVAADIGAQADVQRLLAAALARYDRIDVAINNAGIEHAAARLAEIDEATWDRVIGVNLKGTWLCMKHELTQMVAQGGGAIVNTASVAGLGGAPTLGAYVAAKHGVVGLTRTGALEYAKYGIRVNAVCPSFARTAMVERMVAAKPQLASVFERASPMQRMAKAGEVVAAIVWLASDSASFVNGQALAIDGGMNAW
ncbi:MAG: glucose 1-dehydrogenase [Gammaproteobacteria bacterium]|nr:glucose 1-dehydrogenase [Gammaproteobacteria bacterium]